MSSIISITIVMTYTFHCNTNLFLQDERKHVYMLTHMHMVFKFYIANYILACLYSQYKCVYF